VSLYLLKHGSYSCYESAIIQVNFAARMAPVDLTRVPDDVWQIAKDRERVIRALVGSSGRGDRAELVATQATPDSPS